MNLPKPFHGSRSPPAAAGSEKPTIVRFGPSEIVLHWSLVLPYLTLAVSGILLLARKNIDLPWASRELLKDLHLYAGGLLIALPSLVLMGTRPDPYLRTSATPSAGTGRTSGGSTPRLCVSYSPA